MKIPRLFLALLLCVAAASGQEKQESALDQRLRGYAEKLGMTYRQTWLAASKVVVTDGADEYDAYVLSAAYLYAYINGCSSIRTLRDEPTRWVAATLVGEPPGEPGPLIFVEKTTGATSSPHNKTVTDPKTYLELERQ